VDGRGKQLIAGKLLQEMDSCVAARVKQHFISTTSSRMPRNMNKQAPSLTKIELMLLSIKFLSISK